MLPENWELSRIPYGISAGEMQSFDTNYAVEGNSMEGLSSAYIGIPHSILMRSSLNCVGYKTCDLVRQARSTRACSQGCGTLPPRIWVEIADYETHYAPLIL